MEPMETLLAADNSGQGGQGYEVSEGGPVMISNTLRRNFRTWAKQGDGNFIKGVLLDGLKLDIEQVIGWYEEHGEVHGHEVFGHKVQCEALGREVHGREVHGREVFGYKVIGNKVLGFKEVLDCWEVLGSKVIVR